MKSKSKIKDYILIVIMCVVCLWVYKNQAIILDKIIMLNPHYIELDVADENRDIITIGEKVVDIKDLVGAPGRAKEQGGATLIYELPTPCEPGQYYLRINGYTKKYAGRLLISLYDDENEKGYEGATFFSGILMEYSMVIPADTTFNKVKLLWQNTENVPSLTDFQLVRLPENQDINELEIGVKPEEGSIETITLGPEDKVVDGEVTCAVARGDALVYAQENRLCTLLDGKTEESVERDNIVNLYVDYYENLYVIFENGDMDVRYKDGGRKTYDWTNFEQKPVDVLVAGEYMFVPEGYGGVEIFKIEDEGIRYLSKLFFDNRYYFSKVVVKNHSAYALVNGNVEWFDIAYICNPVYKKKIYDGRIATDILISGDNLYVTSSNNNNIARNGRYLGDEESGLSIYKLEYSGNVKIIDGWRMEKTDLLVVAQPDEIGKSIIINIAEDGLYYIKKTNDVLVKTNEFRVKTKERPFEYEPQFIYTKDNTIEVFKLESGNIVKDAVILNEHYVVGTSQGIVVYSQNTKERLYQEKITWTQIDKCDKDLIVVDKNQIIIYAIEEKGLIEKKRIALNISTINSLYVTKNKEIIVCGDDEIVIVNQYQDYYPTLNIDGVQGVKAEIQDGYIVYDDNAELLYITLKNQRIGVQKIELVGDGSILTNSNELEWMMPYENGYLILQNGISNNQDGVEILYCPQKLEVYEWGEIMWCWLSVLDKTYVYDKSFFEIQRENNQLYWLERDLQAITSKVLINNRNKVYDLDYREKQIIVATGRDGAIVYKKLDETNR